MQTNNSNKNQSTLNSLNVHFAVELMDKALRLKTLTHFLDQKQELDTIGLDAFCDTLEKYIQSSNNGNESD